MEAYADRETRERQRLQAENVALEGQVGAGIGLGLRTQGVQGAGGMGWLGLEQSLP